MSLPHLTIKTKHKSFRREERVEGLKYPFEDLSQNVSIVDLLVFHSSGFLYLVQSDILEEYEDCK
jgi:hypothetical protein